MLETVKVFSSRLLRNPDRVTLAQRRGGHAVVSVMPKYKSDPTSEDYGKYCQQFLLLHMPFRVWNDVTQGFPDPQTAYADFVNQHPDPNNNPEPRNLEQLVRNAEEEINANVDVIPAPEHIHEPWMDMQNPEPGPGQPIEPLLTIGTITG